MEKIQFVIVDYNIEYIHSLQHYIREKKFYNLFTVRAFTKSNVIEEFLETEHQIDILLVSTEAYKALDSPLTTTWATAIVLLIEELNEQIDDLPSVLKYQSFSSLIEEVLSIYELK